MVLLKNSTINIPPIPLNISVPVNPPIQYVIEDIPSVTSYDQFDHIGNNDILIHAIYNLINSINIY